MNRSRPIHSAAMKVGIEELECVIAAGADVNEKGENGRSALHYAAAFGNAEMEKLLVQKGACIDCTDNFKKAPWEYAANPNSRRLDYVSYLAEVIGNGVEPKSHTSCTKRL